MDANKIQYNIRTLLSAVRKMRKAQKTFRKEKNTNNYHAMLDAENVVDEIISAKNSDFQQ